ncbi:site-specific recombinase XerD [Jatrophihabitans sp. GAS493]|uniref:tyrosine-type recombinase/integrase n=1 Tax=Jatrophihabitans sp. GAS493 TaxID=1907575 RepID=UPI000BB866E3|nr:site-specific integrase [Jatrophihabitans sp. GAS493]SOD73459.1 site-specific recombinase XerD [Jatrophihabitans sp. GAS493]
MASRVLPVGVRRVVGRDGVVTFQARWYDRGGGRHAATFDTVAEADAHRQEQMRSRRFGGSADPSGGRTALSVWFWRWHEIRKARPSTKSVALSNARTNMLPRFGDWRLCDIRPSDVSAWVADMVAAGLAPSTAGKNLQLLSACLKAAVAEGLIASSPADHVHAPDPDPDEARFLLPAELVAIEQAMDPWWRPIVPFVADTGLRIGEFAALRVKDLDLVRGRVRVVESAVEVPKAVSGAATRRTQGDPKTKASLRVVPTITPSVAQLMEKMIATRKLCANDPLFAGRQGAPLSPNNWRKRVWYPAVERAGLGSDKNDPSTPAPHSLRHTAVALWIASGVTEPLRLARWAGHRSINTTYRVYGHLLPEDANPTRTALEAIRSAARQEVGRTNL